MALIKANEPKGLTGRPGTDLAHALADGLQQSIPLELHLTPAEQRKIAELEVGGPCVRLLLTEHESKSVLRDKPDFTHGQLKDGRFFCWRRKSDLDELRASASPADRILLAALERRILDDSVE